MRQTGAESTEFLGCCHRPQAEPTFPIGEGRPLSDDSRVRIVLALALLAACGRSEPYRCDGLGASVESEVPLDCPGLGNNMKIARALLLDGDVGTAEEIDRAFAKTRFHLHDSLCLAGGAESGSCRMGRTYAGSGDVELTRTSGGLVHEMIHRIEDERAPVVTALGVVLGGHVGWPDGYHQAQADYEARANFHLRMEGGSAYK
jgi:hypothetical protein